MCIPKSYLPSELLVNKCGSVDILIGLRCQLIFDFQLLITATDSLSFDHKNNLDIMQVILGNYYKLNRFRKQASALLPILISSCVPGKLHT